MNQKLFKKVFLSVISLLLAITTLATSTYAWMSLNAEAWVEGMQFTATGGEGFLISVDGVRYKTQLTQLEIYQAIVCKYKEYEFVDSEVVDKDGNILTEDEITNLVKEIKLEPITSINDKAGQLPLTNLLNQDASKDSYLEFDIYFKRVDNSEAAREVKIYLNGEAENYSENFLVPQTSITSVKEYVTLKTGLNCIIRDENEAELSKNRYYAGDKIAVHSSNATRLGIISNVAEQVVELTNNYDLGSYATDSNEIKYYADMNAMFTYYNNLKNNSLQRLSYENDLPKNYYTSLLDKNGENQVLMCSLKGNEAEKVTFKLWLEGWDADCFDGIGKSISVQLSFVQEKEY